MDLDELKDELFDAVQDALSWAEDDDLDDLSDALHRVREATDELDEFEPEEDEDG